MILELAEHEARDGVPLDAVQAGLLARSGIVEVRPSRRGDGTWEVAAGHHVGVVRAGGVELHVRPKVPVRRLLEMLLATVELPFRADVVSAAEVADVSRAVVAVFLLRAEEALRWGPLAGYTTRDDEAQALRGRLRVAAQVARRPGLPLPLLVRYDELNADVLPNRLIRSAAFRLSFVPGLPSGDRSRLARIEGLLAEATPLRPGEPFPDPVLRRDQQHYVEIVRLAVLVLRHLSIDARAGSAQGLGFAVDMNRLFQAWLTRRLSGPARRLGLEVRGEWPVALDAAGVLRGRADVVLLRRGRPVFVLDVKYKRGGEPADRYQAIAYARALRLPSAHLVRPGGGPTTRWSMVPDGIELVEHELDLAQVVDDARLDRIVAGIPAAVG